MEWALTSPQVLAEAHPRLRLIDDVSVVELMSAGHHNPLVSTALEAMCRLPAWRNTMRLLVDDFFAEVDELVSWAQHQPASAATREQVLRRYHALLRERATPLAQLLHEGQAALRDVAAGAQLRSRFDRLADLLVDCGDRGDPIDARLRARLAFVALHMGTHRFGAGNEEARQAALQIALDLIAHTPDPG